jgi:excisionase family DNA binding protein
MNITSATPVATVRGARAARKEATAAAAAAGDRFVSIGDAAVYLGVDPMTIRNMIKDGRLQAWTLGPRILRIRLSDIESALQPYGGAHAAP